MQTDDDNNETFDIRGELNEMLSKLIDFIPNLIGALLVLLIGYFIASAVAKLVTRTLRRLRFDRAVHNSPLGNMSSRVIDSPSHFAGTLTYWLLFLGVLSFAISILSLPVLDQILGTIYSYIPRVISAVLIFLVATTVSTAAVSFTQRVMGRTPMGKIVATVIPALTMSLAVFMILNQLGIAKDIVNILFTAIVGSVALGLALAFGLGGREVASELLGQAVAKARQNQGAVEAEVRTAARNARSER